ncbi:MAG: hypothetical protein UY47_C0007G0025 [Parcubacteria group bacterium GW2011_GWB1_49_7]|nr:MAG: hypothetical protein UX71_C0002G0141 [Parcubacteria group bacterium GW2011_GWA1_47_10]KKW09684.1 MAG: hypothetical protein UY47_C0007G0025 [Parcubacteria group bacterium GW2011_GWB1_49_7]
MWRWKPNSQNRHIGGFALLEKKMIHQTLKGLNLNLDELSELEKLLAKNLLGLAGGQEMIELSNRGERGDKKFCLKIPGPRNFKQDYEVVLSRLSFDRNYVPAGTTFTASELLLTFLEDLAERLAIVKDHS